MARLYANENMDLEVVEIIRNFNHDVLIALEAGKANQGIPDEEVLAFAHREGRIVLTFNYQDFKKLHLQNPNHSGIIICKEDKNILALANRIQNALETSNGKLAGQLVRITRPNLNTKV
ncbi:MAG: DUF5615 family PIN-like protein [Saprospiraceae bacterium]